MDIVVGGCDVGSATGKAVIMRGSEISACAITPVTTKPEETAYVEDVTVSGGCAKNKGLFESLQKKLEIAKNIYLRTPEL